MFPSCLVVLVCTSWKCCRGLCGLNSSLPFIFSLSLSFQHDAYCAVPLRLAWLKYWVVWAMGIEPRSAYTQTSLQARRVLWRFLFPSSIRDGFLLHHYSRSLNSTISESFQPLDAYKLRERIYLHRSTFASMWFVGRSVAFRGPERREGSQSYSTCFCRLYTYIHLYNV